MQDDPADGPGDSHCGNHLQDPAMPFVHRR
jgi:hypothetical protein